MSDLQFGLLAIGAVVVAGVFGFNWIQERRFQRRVEQAFGEKQPDVLLHPDARPGADAPARAAAPASSNGEDDRIEPKASIVPDVDLSDEPRLGSPAPVTEPAAPANAQGNSSAADAGDSVIDFVVEVVTPRPLPANAVAETVAKIAAQGQPAVAYAFDGGWTALSDGREPATGQLALAFQLASRRGPATIDALRSVAALATTLAGSGEGQARVPPVDAAAAAAQTLDRFCIDVDIAVGLNVVARAGASFPGRKIQQALAKAGLTGDEQLQFVLRDGAGKVLFNLVNQDGAAFRAVAMQDAVSRGLTLLLDVPRVADGVKVLDQMATVARQLAVDLGGTLVDDNRVALSEAGLERIRSQLRTVYAKMDARGIPAGSVRALRLFS
jgi:hypothetical protein